MENKQETQTEKMNRMQRIEAKVEEIGEKAVGVAEDIGNFVFKAIDFLEKHGNTFSGLGAGTSFTLLGAYMANGNAYGAVIAAFAGALLTANTISGLKKEEKEKAVGNEYKNLAKKAGLTETEVKNTIEKAINEHAAKKAAERGNGKLGQFKPRDNNDKGLEI